MNNETETRTITFDFLADLPKSICVRKKIKKKYEKFFIPRSVIISQTKHTDERRAYKDAFYDIERIDIEIPRWFINKVIYIK